MEKEKMTDFIWCVMDKDELVMVYDDGNEARKCVDYLNQMEYYHRGRYYVRKEPVHKKFER
jgi:hypothetical protein